MIIGRPGSGKSTVARHLGQRLCVPIIYLDVLFWRPGWKEPDRNDFRTRVAHAHSGDSWISDGSYAESTFDLRLPRADALIVLERPRWLCLVRVLRRSLSAVSALTGPNVRSTSAGISSNSFGSSTR